MGAQKNGLENSLKRSTKNGSRGAVTLIVLVSLTVVWRIRVSNGHPIHSCMVAHLRMRLSHMHAFGRCVGRGHGRRG